MRFWAAARDYLRYHTHSIQNTKALDTKVNGRIGAPCPRENIRGAYGTRGARDNGYYGHGSNWHKHIYFTLFSFGFLFGEGRAQIKGEIIEINPAAAVDWEREHFADFDWSSQPPRNRVSVELIQ